MASVNVKKLIGYGILTGLLAGLLVVLYFFDPAKAAAFPPCPFNLLTGYHCPGCGSLRGLHSLLHGRLVDALSLNPLMVVSIPILGFMSLNPTWIYKRWVPWLAFSILVGYGVIRNIPIGLFECLAPK